jgi:prepilin-type N-terminal cleavage/methylation domain-containing protein
VPERANAEAGYSLIEVLTVVAMIAILMGVSAETLGQQPAQLSSSIQQFSAMVAQTRALALANAGQLGVGDGTSVAAATGATLWVQPDPTDPNYTIATLYWYRPILQNPCRGCVQLDTTTPPLRMRVQMTAAIPSDGSNSAFAIFVSPSGHLSAITGPKWSPGQGPIETEPICDPNNPPTILFSSNGNQQVRHLTCQGAFVQT